MYLPALVVPYGLSDDYLYLAQAEELGLPSPPYNKSVMHAAAAEGRPLWGALVKPVFAVAGTIDNLRFVRLATVLGIVVLACVLFWALVRSKVGRLPAALIALLVCTMPPFQLYASWSVAFMLPWTALLAGTSSLLAVAGMEAPRQALRPARLGDRAAGGRLLDLPASGDVLLGVLRRRAGRLRDGIRASAAAGEGTLRRRRRRRGGRVCRLQDLHLAGRGPDALGANRGAITGDIAGKAEWFAHWALYGALNLFDVTWSAWSAALVTAVAAGGIVLWLLRRATRPWLTIGLAAILIPLTVLPSLVVEETYHYEAYRALVSLSALIALYFGLGALALWLMFREWLEGRVSRRALLASERVATVLAVAFVATAAVSGVEKRGHAHRRAAAERAAAAARPGRRATRARPERVLRAVRPRTNGCPGRRSPTSSDIRRRARGTRPSRSCCCSSANRGGSRTFTRPSPSCRGTRRRPDGAPVLNLNGLLGRGEPPWL